MFSAPGKAFLAGGYLVLDPKYRAFVVALSSRMYAHAEIVSEGGDTTEISVRSPQFLEGDWTYKVDLSRPTQSQEVHGRKNPFIKATLDIILLYLSPKVNKSIVITIFSDAGYHSQTNSVPKTSESGKRTFRYHSQPITEVSKTGLGSSAGLVASLTAALLSCYVETLDVKNDATLNQIHNLAQISHCLAQGKIGSGFDVASATFGSIVYRRFDPELVNKVIETWDREYLVNLVDNVDWKIEISKCALPSGVKLLMGDIVGGSETPKLVSKVLSWRKENASRSLEVWETLNKNNMSLVSGLERLQTMSKEQPETYKLLLQSLVAGNKSGFQDVVSSIQGIRKYLKIMTQESGAEIEPDQQTKLLDYCMSLDGVLGGVVPGAGGYDAVCLLVAEDSIPQVIENTQNHSVTWLDLREQELGLRQEDVSEFSGLF
ncbi:hypothetical protein OGAPHI_006053 [Ogataea philodendri]|uniref:Phosphomevalonate kinase n=1 Tax=Ogataea philodendri TaxID=1378263 RepID=A0A9P8NZF2_9ASCO|nr:uncharacterized protein OGAPHI_006053 [Ogataea philodendri]KAH3661874.1 hypothetical protein OGAPHI_006053 [Ogataea philodendri]